jgi:hypothetical protein
MFLLVVVVFLCCTLQLVYPSAKLQAAYATNRPAIYTSVIVVAFAMTAVLLFVYDWLVTRRQDKTMASALRTDRIVASLFPEAVRDRLMNLNDSAGGRKGSSHPDDGLEAGTPIADFFPHTVSVCVLLIALLYLLRGTTQYSLV